jgi:hypothetical protein
MKQLISLIINVDYLEYDIYKTWTNVQLTRSALKSSILIENYRQPQLYYDKKYTDFVRVWAESKQT